MAAFSLPQARADQVVSHATNNLIIPRDHGGDGSAWGYAKCQSCHVMKVIHRKVPVIRRIVRQKGYKTCAGCHGSNGTQAIRRCTVCHNQKDLPTSPILEGTHKHDFLVAGIKQLKDKQCLACHEASDMDGRFETNVDLTVFPNRDGIKTAYENPNAFCFRCHNVDHQQPGYAVSARPLVKPDRGPDRDPLVAIETQYSTLDKHGDVDGIVGLYQGLRDSGYVYHSTVDCVDCHAMHGTPNTQLLIGSSMTGVFKLNQAFRAQDFKVSVETGNSAQLCVLCHQTTRPELTGDENFDGVQDGYQDTGNGLSGIHQVQGDCTECHYHGSPSSVSGL